MISTVLDGFGASSMVEELIKRWYLYLDTGFDKAIRIYGHDYLGVLENGLGYR
jgi:hypothetical protein